MNMSFHSVTPYRQFSQFMLKKKTTRIVAFSQYYAYEEMKAGKSSSLGNLLSLILVVLGVSVPQIEHWWDECIYRRYKSDMKIKLKLTTVVIENIQLVSQLYSSTVIGWKRRVEICHSGTTTILHRSVSRARSSVVVSTIKKRMSQCKKLENF